jgi:type IV secretion system protein VirB2
MKCSLLSHRHCCRLCLCFLMCCLYGVSYNVHAASNGAAAFGGVTEFLKSITHLLIFEWGYYIGIITLAIQGYRWKTGRIDLMQLGGWGLGIALVLFAPNIVGDLKSRSGGHL